jgi:hypothetical protein
MLGDVTGHSLSRFNEPRMSERGAHAVISGAWPASIKQCLGWWPVRQYPTPTQSKSQAIAQQASTLGMVVQYP